MAEPIEKQGFADDSPEIGRVLRASTAGFAIGSRVGQLSVPSFGCLVKAQPLEEREAIYGLIYDMHIDDDPLVRRLVLAEEPQQSVIEDQRSNRLLPIEMSVLTVGYRMKGEIHQALPPRPPLNLDPVYMCQHPPEVREFTENSSYLRLVLGAAERQVPVDQLLAAHIQQAYELRGSDDQWALGAVHNVSDLLRGDYDRLIPFLEAISAALPEIGELGSGVGEL